MKTKILKINYSMKYLCILFLFFTIHITYSQTLSDYIVNLSTPQSLELDGNNLYFSEMNGNISIVDITQNNPVPSLLASGITFPTGLEIYGTELFIGDYGSGIPPYNGKIFKMDLSATNPIPIEIVSGIANPSTLLAHQGFLYYSEVNSGTISKIDLSITNPTPITVINTTCSCRIYGLEISGNELYYSQSNSGNYSTIYKIDVTNASTTPVFVMDSSSGFTSAHRLRKIGDYIYVSDIISDKVFKFNMTDNNPSLELVVSNVNGAKDCIPYLDDLYIVESAANKILKLSKYNLGVDEFYLNETIKLYPNPSNDYIIISNINEAFEYKILSTLGQLIIQGKSEPNKKINISRLEQGTYYLFFKNGYTKRFIKN